METINPSSLREQFRVKFIDIMALVVAIIAVVISVMQARTQKQLTIANWQPSLIIEFIRLDSLPMRGFLLKNVGFGPAKIDTFRYFRNEADYRAGRSFQQWLTLDGFSKSGIMLGLPFDEINDITRGYVLSNKAEDYLFLLGTKAKPFFGTQTRASMDSVIIEIKYRSLSAADDEQYYLRFCQLFVSNNITNKDEKNIYESL